MIEMCQKTQFVQLRHSSIGRICFQGNFSLRNDFLPRELNQRGHDKDCCKGSRDFVCKTLKSHLANQKQIC